MSPIKKKKQNQSNNKLKKKNLKPHTRKHKQDNLDIFHSTMYIFKYQFLACGQSSDLAGEV